MDTLPFEDWPDGPLVIVVPETVESLSAAFVKRNAYNFTHQERMRKELDELIALVRAEKN